MTLRFDFRTAQIFLELRRPRNVLHALSMSRLVAGFITHGVIILALRAVWVYKFFKSPTLSVHCAVF